MPSNGWHRADIVAAIHKRDTTLSQLARDHGLNQDTLRAALTYPRKPSNKIIAAFVGRSLHELWPAWFDTAGNLIVSRAKAASRRRRASSQKRNAA